MASAVDDTAMRASSRSMAPTTMGRNRSCSAVRPPVEWNVPTVGRSETWTAKRGSVGAVGQWMCTTSRSRSRIALRRRRLSENPIAKSTNARLNGTRMFQPIRSTPSLNPFSPRRKKLVMMVTSWPR